MIWAVKRGAKDGMAVEMNVGTRKERATRNQYFAIACDVDTTRR